VRPRARRFRRRVHAIATASTGSARAEQRFGLGSTDWREAVSWIAAIALLFAAIFGLKLADRPRLLGPPVRVAIGCSSRGLVGDL